MPTLHKGNRKIRRAKITGVGHHHNTGRRAKIRHARVIGDPEGAQPGGARRQHTHDTYRCRAYMHICTDICMHVCTHACIYVSAALCLLVRCPSRVCACPPAVHHHTYLLSRGYTSCMYVCWTPCVYASTALCLFVRYFPAYNTRVLSHYYSITTRNTIHRAMSARYSCAQATISHFQTFRR